MADFTKLSEQINANYKDGLTAVVVIAGTRTTYMLENYENQTNPGLIKDFWEYAYFLLERYVKFISMLFKSGIKNVIIPFYSYQGFYERGEDYTTLAMETSRLLIGKDFANMYKQHNIDPYFVGLDTIHHLPANHLAHHLKLQFNEFADQWAYQTDNKKLIWEVVPIPLYSYLQVETPRELATKIEATSDLRDLHDMVYRHYSTHVYGFELPQPDFYIGSNRNGDIKIRAMYPISMLCGSPCRFYFLPYPTLYLTEETLRFILDDLINGSPLRAKKKDYSGQVTPDMLKAEQERIQRLSQDPSSVIGLTRST